MASHFALQDALCLISCTWHDSVENSRGLCIGACILLGGCSLLGLSEGLSLNRAQQLECLLNQRELRVVRQRGGGE